MKPKPKKMKTIYLIVILIGAFFTDMYIITFAFGLLSASSDIAVFIGIFLLLILFFVNYMLVSLSIKQFKKPKT